MDLNTALMESISEYFVVANTRTSFTDLAESGSLGTMAGHSNHSSNNQHSLQQHHQHHHHLSSSLNHHSSQSNLNQQFSVGGPTVHKGLVNSNQLQQQHASNNGNSNSSNIQSNSQSSSQQLGSPSCNPNHYQNHNLYSSGHGQRSSSGPSNTSSSTNAGMQSRLAQPVRTQIPIHCYIEQLDDLPGYTPTLSDSDLFNTTNRTTSTQVSQTVHQNQPHLHQSKLALESVTNSNGSNISLSSVANTSSLFNENETNNDNNELDTKLDHLSSTSSINHHLTGSPNITAATANGTLSNIVCNTSANRQSTSNFQTCRETYAIVTSNVLYQDLVRTVLLQLGYSDIDLINAKATIQIKNWKPLTLDQVTEDKSATVGQVLGDISTFVTLRIRLFSSLTQLPTEWTETQIRQAVLRLTQTMSQLTLSKLCNISQPLISSIVRGGKKLGRRKCVEFGQWYANYIKSTEARPASLFSEGGGARLVFDKSREIPQLKAWFANNTKPSDELLEEYSKILNDSSLRKDRPQVTGKALKNWWKNERQKLGIRQREIRNRPKLKRID